MKPAVSVLVPARNERCNIEGCLRSVAWCDDVVVVDSASTDGTAELAAALGARVVQFQYLRGGLKKKNWALANVEFKHEWVFILDADERMTDDLTREIHDALRGPEVPYAGYYVNRRTYFLGRWIRHGGYYPSWNLRLMKLRLASYEVVPDFSGDTGDNEVHEHVLLSGAAGYLSAPLDHHAFPSIAVFVEKHNRYSSWEAGVDWPPEPGRSRAGDIAPHLRLRRTLMGIARRLPFSDLARFMYHYGLRLGFLDGREGYIFCRLLAEYEFLTAAKRFEKARREPAAMEPEQSRWLPRERELGH